MEYLDFDVEVKPGSAGAYDVSVVQSPAVLATGTGTPSTMSPASAECSEPASGTLAATPASFRNARRSISGLAMNMQYTLGKSYGTSGGANGANTAANNARTEEGFARSLARLRTDHVYGLLVHGGSDLLGPEGARLAEWLLLQREKGRAARVGVSIYEPDEAREIFERFDFDIVQAPLNVLDQRMITSGTLEWLSERRVEVHVRSVFLQGALLAGPGRLRGRAARLEPVLERYKPAHDTVWLVYPATRHLSPKVRAFIDFLVARFR